MPLFQAFASAGMPAVKKLLISNPELDINAVNTNGDTISHVIMKNLFRIYDPHALEPFFETDLEMLLTRGANFTLKNANAQTPMAILFDDPIKASRFDFKDIRQYFSLIQKFSPELPLVIELVNFMALRTKPFNMEKCLAMRFSFYDRDWMEEQFVAQLSIQDLPIRLLKDLLGSIYDGFFNKLISQTKLENFKLNLIEQIDFLGEHPGLDAALQALTVLDADKRACVFHAVLLNYPELPFRSIIEKLLTLKSHLKTEHSKTLQKFMDDYQASLGLVENLKSLPYSSVVVVALTDREKNIARPLYMNIQAALAPLVPFVTLEPEVKQAREEIVQNKNPDVAVCVTITAPQLVHPVGESSFHSKLALWKTRDKKDLDRKETLQKFESKKITARKF